MTLRTCVVTLLLALGIASAQTADRAAAEWVLRLGGTVTLEGQAQPLAGLSDLPPGDFYVQGINLVGTLVEPKEMIELQDLTHLRELFLPGPMWDPHAGSKLDANDELAYLSRLTHLEKLHVSLHFLSNINIQDKGVAHLAPLTALQELRLAQTKITGTTLAPFVHLRFLDASETPFTDDGIASLKGMTALSKLYLRNTLVTDKGLRILGDLKSLTELDLYGVSITDAGLAHLKGLTGLRKLNLLGSEVTDAGVESLAGMTQIEELN